jgi:hypothetical protein
MRGGRHDGNIFFQARISSLSCVEVARGSLSRNSFTGGFMPQRNLISVRHCVPWDRGAVVLAVPGVLLMLLAILTLRVPRASAWISEIAQAEFVGSDRPVLMPAQLARPLGDVPATGVN